MQKRSVLKTNKKQNQKKKLLKYNKEEKQTRKHKMVKRPKRIGYILKGDIYMYEEKCLKMNIVVQEMQIKITI